MMRSMMRASCEVEARTRMIEESEKMRPIALPYLLVSSCLEPLPQGGEQNQQQMHTLIRHTTKCACSPTLQPWLFLLPSTWLSGSADPQCDPADLSCRRGWWLVGWLGIGANANAKEWS